MVVEAVGCLFHLIQDTAEQRAVLIGMYNIISVSVDDKTVRLMALPFLVFLVNLFNGFLELAPHRINRQADTEDTNRCPQMVMNWFGV